MARSTAWGSTASLNGAGVGARGGGVALQPASMSSESAAPGILEHGEVMVSTAKVSHRLRFENRCQKAIAAYLVTPGSHIGALWRITQGRNAVREHAAVVPCLGLTLLVSLVVACAPRDQEKGGQRELSGEGWIDVTATLDPATTPVYQGDAPMKFDFLKDMRKGDILTLSVYSLGAHSGTHIDAPMHFVANGAPIDQVPLDPLIGAARVIEIPDSVQAIDAAELNRHDWKGAKRVLFRTRSTLRGWMDSSMFHRDFAYIAPDAAQLLADARVLLVGVDYISAEQFGAPAPRTHQILLGRGIPIVEGLDLRPVQAGDYDLIVLPLKVAGHEAAPARAIVRKRRPDNRSSPPAPPNRSRLNISVATERVHWQSPPGRGR